MTMKYNISNKKLKGIYKKVNSKLPKANKYRNFEDFKFMYMTHKMQGTQNIQRQMIYEAKYSTGYKTAVAEHQWVAELKANGYDVPGISLEELKKMDTQTFAEKYGSQLNEYKERKFAEEYSKAIESGLSHAEALKQSKYATRMYISQYIFRSI